MRENGIGEQKIWEVNPDLAAKLPISGKEDESQGPMLFASRCECDTVIRYDKVKKQLMELQKAMFL